MNGEPENQRTENQQLHQAFKYLHPAGNLPHPCRVFIHKAAYCQYHYYMHPKSESAFEEIILGCRKKDGESQRLLYQHFYAYGMSICIRYADSQDEAMQILNDGFLKVYRNIKKYDINRPFKAWFRTILVNTAINHLRRYKNQKLQVNMDDMSHVPTAEDIISRISYKDLMAMVQSLSAAYRTVFNLYVIDGYKHEEISKMLGIAVGTSKSNLSKAREKLREMIIENLGTKYA